MICNNCRRKITDSTLTKCPYCGSVKTYLVKGNEFNIKEIEAR